MTSLGDEAHDQLPFKQRTTLNTADLSEGLQERLRQWLRYQVSRGLMPELKCRALSFLQAHLPLVYRPLIALHSLLFRLGAEIRE